MVAPLDDVRIPMVAKPPGAVGSIGATSAPGVIGAASVAGAVGADHKRGIGYHAFFGTGDPTLSVKRPFLDEPSPESVASTPPLWARKTLEGAPEPPTLRSLEAEVLAVVDRAESGKILCANLPKLYYTLHGAPLNCATYGEDRLSDLLAKLPNVYVCADARGRGGTVSRRGTGAEDGDVPDAAALEAQAAGREAYRAAGVNAKVRDWSPTRLREASGATESSAAEALYQAVAAPRDRVQRTGLLLAHARTAPVTAEPEQLRALAAEILALVDEAPGGKVLSANLPRAYFLEYRKALDMKSYGALKMSRLLAALEPYGLESCGGAAAGVGRAGSGVADAGPVADVIAPPPEDLASLRAELESTRGAEAGGNKPPTPEDGAAKRGETVDAAGCTASPAQLERLANQVLALCDASPSYRVMLANLPVDYKRAYGAPMPKHGVKAKTLMALLPGVAVGGYDPSHVDPENRWARAHVRRDDGAGAPAPPPPPSARQPAPTAGDAEELGRTVFVRGLPWDAQEAEVRSWMESAGPVASLVLPPNRGDGRPSGTAFVVFDAPAGADAACATLGGGEFFPGTKRRVTVVMADRPCPTRATKMQRAARAACSPPASSRNVARNPRPRSETREVDAALTRLLGRSRSARARGRSTLEGRATPRA